MNPLVSSSDAPESGRAARRQPNALRSMPTGAALLVALRPKQWTKNLLVFAGLVFTYNLANVAMLSATVGAFAVFCALSSAGYLWNDVRDAPADRRHPLKQRRPIASGRLSTDVAMAAALVLAVGGLGVAFSQRPAFGAVAAGYLLLTVAYSAWLKHLVLIDIFAIAAGFVLRAVGGAVVIGVPVSPWLYVCTVLAALLLALGKRRHELVALAGAAQEHRRNLEQYTVELVDQLVLIVATAAIIAYSLYTFSAENLPRDHSMMLTIPFVLYGVFRYLYLVRVRGEGGAPEDMLLSDPGLLATVLGWGLASVTILYLVPR
jgi:4-hydroxybenzoate polyprenyltransferase